jgi:hypothetical protein
VVLDVQEAGRPEVCIAGCSALQVRIAVCSAGVDGRHLHCGLDGRLLERLTDGHDRGEVLELATDLAHQGSASGETDFAVRGVDVPDAGGRSKRLLTPRS